MYVQIQHNSGIEKSALQCPGYRFGNRNSQLAVSSAACHPADELISLIFAIKSE